jgi:hypothetical protein
MVENRELKVQSVAFALENGRDKTQTADAVIADAKKIYEYLSAEDASGN